MLSIAYEYSKQGHELTKYAWIGSQAFISSRTVNPFVFQYLHLPKKEDVNINFRSYWNAGVFYTFDFIANLPSKVINLKDYVVDFASSPSVSDKKEESEKVEESNAEPKAADPSPAPEVLASQEKATEDT